MALRWRPAARLAGHLCRLLLAGVFLLAGTVKALNPEGLAAEVIQYGILPNAVVVPFAFTMIVVELAVGAALLLNFRPVASLWISAGLMVMFIGAIGFALATDQPLTECGCFGSNMPRTPQETLREDLGFLAAALIGVFALRGGAQGGSDATPADSRPARSWKGLLVGGVTLASGAFVIASPHLPIDDFATALKPGVRWETLNVAMADTDLKRDSRLVALMGMRDPASVESLGALNALAASGRVQVVGLYADDDAAYNEFFWTRGPAFPLYHATSSDLRRLHRRLPRFFTLKDGVVTATWLEPPTLEQAAGALK